MGTACLLLFMSTRSTRSSWSKRLFQPYPPVTDGPVRMAAMAAGLVCLTLLLFRPGGMHEVPPFDLLYLSLGYGLVTFAICLTLNLVLPRLFPRFFQEETWVVWKELVYFSIVLGFISVGNFFFAQATFDHHESGLNGLWLSVVYTVIVGIVPITVSVFLRQIALLNQHLAAAQQMNQSLHQHHPHGTGSLVMAQPAISTGWEAEGNSSWPAEVAPAPALVYKSNEDGGAPAAPAAEAIPAQITIELEEAGKVSFDTASMLFFAAADNYVELFMMQNGQLKKQLYRGSLKNVEQNLAGLPFMFRCHRSYLVNMLNVQGIGGNSQGYRLKMGFELEVPVSRASSEELKKRLTA